MTKSTLLFSVLLACAVRTFAQPDGTLDLSFMAGTPVQPQETVNSTIIQPDGKIIVIGHFNQYDFTNQSGIVRLFSDGQRDPSFNPPIYPDRTFYASLAEPDGKVLIAGFFADQNNNQFSNLIRLNQDGTINTDLNPAASYGEHIRTLALQPDGKIILGGEFSSYKGIIRPGIARINPDGSLDASFNPGSGFLVTGQFPRCIALQPDGKILVGGWITSYNGIPVGHIIRLNSDGTLDSGFITGTGANDALYSIVIQPDGKILAAGRFSNYNGNSANGIIRLNPDGSPDYSFVTGTGFAVQVSPIQVPVHTLRLQPDGKILAGGEFTHYNGIASAGIARLLPNGSLDPDFQLGTGFLTPLNPLPIIVHFNLQPDGRILATGRFLTYNGQNRTGIVRINNAPVTGQLDRASFETEAFPNPFRTKITFRFSARHSAEYQVKILNLSGQQVLLRTINASADEVHLQEPLIADLPKGVYIVQVFDGQNVKSFGLSKQ